MKTIIRTGILACILAGGAANALALERPEIHFDDREWKVANQKHEGGNITVDFIPALETPKDWTERFTTQYYGGLQEKMTPEALAAKTRESLEKSCPSIKWESVKLTTYDVVYAWNVSGCADLPDLSEVARIIKGKEAIHALHYTFRKADMPAEKRKQWLKNLVDSRLLS